MVSDRDYIEPNSKVCPRWAEILAAGKASAEYKQRYAQLV
eukprot:CAMPEP_0175973688 /NCGR_PEP_ID=MMETSP0108-20121206/42950_1 /TAXON_ID=195067 ORGANISM="Goniomonas pacifica, Strain CCMP1869" /NCGR_SAMPLE_ID=MMETSP0108 /ASSEMBLY_ACC=CAM_ASM_000204 /LENGTH=39 /DNA_ID= /DNA_START= /DNA_END= /DNA_ORIENTATION=